VAVRAKAPHYTPWRVLMLGRQPGDLIESNIVLNLSDPCALSPTSTLVARYGAVGRDKMSIFNAGVTYLKNSDE
jgi:hypothetical protein